MPCKLFFIIFNKLFNFIDDTMNASLNIWIRGFKLHE